MSGTDGSGRTPWWQRAQGAQDDTLASATSRGLMARWAARSATIASFARQVASGRQEIYVPLATAALAGALSAADKAKLDAINAAFPLAFVTHNADQSIANNTSTVVAFNTEVTDAHGYHDTATNNGRLTVPAGFGGLHLIGMGFTWDAATAGGRRIGQIRHSNGTFYATGETPTSTNVANFPFLSAIVPLNLAAGDYLEVVATQTSGGALNIKSFAQQSANFWIVRLSG